MSEDWNITIHNFGNGHCELKAKNEKGEVFYAYNLDDLLTKVRERVNK